MIPIRDSIPSQHRPWMNWTLLAVNVAVFAYEMTLPVDALVGLIQRWGASPASFQSMAGAIANTPTLITSLFLHGGPGHLLGNMLFLWIFGDNVEDRLGPFRYLIFYLVCGAIAAGAQISAGLDSTQPIIGASGAIGGVMGAYMISYPRAYVLTFIWIVFIIRFVWIPAVVYLALWFLIQLLQATSEQIPGQGGVAFWAHVGGFAAGAGLILTMKKRRPARPVSIEERLDRWRRR